MIQCSPLANYGVAGEGNWGFDANRDLSPPPAPRHTTRSRDMARQCTTEELLEEALDMLTQERDEDCWCYDEVDGAPDSGPPGRCLACRVRDKLRLPHPVAD